METKTDFAAQVAASEKAQEHAQEIMQTRVGGLGGSDANILLKIGRGGLGMLVATDHKRLAIMTGKCVQENWGGNAYTNAGHAFEEWAEQNAPLKGMGYEREKKMINRFAVNFQTFAHADFYADGDVVECKFVQKPTNIVVGTYYAQLQWYYLMGAKNVYLFHGTGQADPFEVEETFLEKIERDEDTIKLLLAGIETLDRALTDGWEPDVTDKVTVGDTPEIVRDAFAKMKAIKETKKVLEEQEKEAKAVLKEYVEGFGLAGIVADDGSKNQIVYTRAGETRTFDVEKFKQDFPKLDLSEYWKVSKRAASVTFK
jgi:hypothetical protein